MKRMELGLIAGISGGIKESFEKIREIGVPTCQISCTAEYMVDRINPKAIKKAADDTGVEITSFFLVFEGQEYDRKRGPETMGFIAEKYRAKRLELAKKFSDLVAEMGIRSITSHVGFIPDDPGSRVYTAFLPVMRKFIGHCGKNGQIFCFETGQEIPSTLKRAIKDIGLPNIGVNLDPANLILYGMANPLDAVEIIGEYVKGMHAKDALWPDRDESLGIEVPLGEGAVNFPLLLNKLRQKGFTGPLTIEREITGEQQKKDILKAKSFLERYL